MPAEYFGATTVAKPDFFVRKYKAEITILEELD